MKYSVFVLSAAIVLFSCNSQPKPASTEKSKSPIDSLMDKVMNGHDEGMARMGRVEKAAQELGHKIDSTKQSKHPDATLIASWGKAKKDLDQSYSSMNKWMDSFDMDMSHMDSTAKIDYLKKHEAWVNSVADSLKTALDNADKILKK